MKDLQPITAGEEPQDALYKLLAHSVQDYAIFFLDPQGYVASWNFGARLIKQYEKSEIIGRHFSVFYTDSDVQRGWPSHELSLATLTGRFEDEGWRVRKDGSQFWANVIITPLRDNTGGLLGYSKITRDVTERKEQEEILKRSEERFRLLVEGVQDYAIYMLDTNGIVTSWNTGATRITGYESQEIIGQHFSKFYSLEDRAKGKPTAELAIAEMHGRAEDEGWRIRKNGSRFWAKVAVTALYNAKGEPYGFAKVTQDLTQRQHAEALEASRNNINEFIAILAHELRNPLAPIRSAVHVMMAGNQDAIPSAPIVKIIDRQSRQLMRIVDDILDVSRLTRGVFTITKKEIPVEDLLARIVEAVRPGCDALGHNLRINIDGAPQQIYGDEARLAQAITNVLNNACRYTPPGGVIVLTVTISGESPQNTCIFSIKDNGQGIESQFINSIFGLFVQGHDKRKISGAGLGVGLALAKSIVELHEGSIKAISEGAGKGSEFIIELPILTASSTKIAPASQDKDEELRILVVDDNEDAAFLLTSYLVTIGYEVATAHSGKEALLEFERKHFQLVLLDIGMPEMDGLELARRIRRLPNGKQAYIAAITGWGKEEDQIRSREAGIDLHLVKPVETEHLATLLSHPTLKANRKLGA